MNLSARKAIGISAALTAVVVVALGVFVYETFPKVCDNKILREFVSPDESKKLIVFQRDCGATTGFSTQASLLVINGTLPDEGGNVFSCDTSHGAAPAGPGGGPELRVRWETPNRVVLGHHTATRIFKAAGRIDGIEIQYEIFR